jgi:hypothetical protein
VSVLHRVAGVDEVEGGVSQIGVEIIEATVADIEGRLIEEHRNERAQDDVATLVANGERQHGLKLVRPRILIVRVRKIAFVGLKYQVVAKACQRPRGVRELLCHLVGALTAGRRVARILPRRSKARRGGNDDGQYRRRYANRDVNHLRIP